MLGRDLVKLVEDKLKENNIHDYLEAEWLVTLSLGKNKISEVYNMAIDQSSLSRVNEVLEERLTGKPLAYIIGNVEFYGRTFMVNSNVLIPRPETELLVESVIKEINSNKKNVKVLDLCTGSGAIGITIALETNAKVSCSDISDKAIVQASINASNLNASTLIIQSDLFDNINDKFDIIVSNPPYIKTNDLIGLDREVRDFEPMLALDGGETGLDFYKKIINLAPEYLNKNGKLFFEIGIGQAKDIVDLMKKNFDEICVIKDYNKIDRVIYGKLRI